MARKSKKDKNKDDSEPGLLASVREETWRSIIAVVFFGLASFFVLAAAGAAGPVGNSAYAILTSLFGVGYYLVPIVCVFLSFTFFKAFPQSVRVFKIGSAAIFFICALALIEIVHAGSGGLAGGELSGLLVEFLDVYASVLLLTTFLAIATLILFNASLERLAGLFEQLRTYGNKDTTDIKEPILTTYGEEEALGDSDDEVSGMAPAGTVQQKAEPFIPEPIIGGAGAASSRAPQALFRLSKSNYTPPPVELLEKDKGKPSVGDTKANANIIKRTLQNFGIQVEMDEILVGPTVTRYALKPAEGVRISKIVSLQNNLELALAAHPIRIEAPIPGKSLVGIEVPNTAKAIIGLASLIGSAEFSGSEKPLLVALGRDIAGQGLYTDIAKMPHMLIAGATGSGKSVTIHDIIMSLLYRNSPEQMRFVMIDPKRVELTLYRDIPHQMFGTVITDAKKAILVLKWAAKEMDRRYDILETERVRDISSYHKNVLAPALEKMEKAEGEESELPEAMPYIVIIIDELADIMQAYPRELEAAIVRLAQMSRAVGIHLLLSTQRPSVNVITGLIKANVPARLALQVASQIDSRTILDTGGAEKLLGAGDSLYQSADMPKPKRLQSPYISESEVKKVVDFIVKNNDKPSTVLDLSDTSESGAPNPLFSSIMKEEAGENDDDLYDAAKDLVIKAGKASTSYLQRRLGIGYGRAAKLLDVLEERGVIGPANGSKPREVLDRFAGPREGGDPLLKDEEEVF